MGATSDAIPQRLARGEADDVLIMVGTALDGLIKDGKAVAANRVDLALPDISTVAKLREALLAARSVVYSDNASGVYLKGELFKRLGTGRDGVRPCARDLEIVARGEADLGLQQVAELLPNLRSRAASRRTCRGRRCIAPGSRLDIPGLPAL